MATIGTKVETIVDVTKRLNPDGTYASIAELMAQDNPVLQDGVWVEANDTTSHRTTVRTGLPTVAWRKLNYGVQPSKSDTAQVTDTIGLLEGISSVDEDILEMNGMKEEFRFSEDEAFIEAMNQNVASTLFYGDTKTNPERFLGLSARYSSLSAKNAKNLINASGTGAKLTSVWLIDWDPKAMHFTYPKGSVAGLKMNDLGKSVKTYSDGSEAVVYRTQFKMKVGFTLRDWRQAARVCNIAVDTLVKNGASGTDLAEKMIMASNALKKRSARSVFYVNKDIHTFLQLQLFYKTNAYLTRDDARDGFGPILRFDGIPVKVCDAIVTGETVVS